MYRKYQIELEQESDGRRIAEIEVLALRILADRLEHGEAPEDAEFMCAA